MHICLVGDVPKAVRVPTKRGEETQLFFPYLLLSVLCKKNPGVEQQVFRTAVKGKRRGESLEISRTDQDLVGVRFPNVGVPFLEDLVNAFMGSSKM